MNSDNPSKDSKPSKFEEDFERKKFGIPIRPNNGTGNDIAAAINYLAEVILYVSERTKK